MAHSVEIKELINGIQITETLDSNIVINEFSYQAKPFIRSTNETDEETYQIIDKVGEVYNIPALATEFVLIDIKDSVYIPANGTELIENSLKLRPFRPDNEPDEFHIGDITTTSNSLTIELPSDNVNWAKIGGVFYEKYYPDTFNFTPVATYQKILIVYAKPDSQVFYLAQGDEALEAIAPTYDGLFVAWILVTVAGSTIDTGERPPFVPLSGTLELHPVTGPIIGSEEFDKEGNRKALAQISDVEDAVNDIDLSPYALDADLDAEIVNRALGDALKLDKPLAPNNVPTRVINADNTTSDKGEFQQSAQVEISANTTATDAMKGKEIWVTASCTFTIPAPSTLSYEWNIDILVFPSVTLTLAITSPGTWLHTTPGTVTDTFFRIARRGNTTTFKTLGL